MGTGTGLATAWILDGMDLDSRLITVDLDPACIEVAKRHLGTDGRVDFRQGDGADVMHSLRGTRFDLIFADAWAGKFWDFQKAVDLLNKGGIYVIDDLLPAPPWPPDHAPKVDALTRASSEASGLDVFSTVLVHGAGSGRQGLTVRGESRASTETVPAPAGMQGRSNAVTTFATGC